MAKRRPRGTNVYNQQLEGVYGVFGSSTGLQAFYLQSAITPSDLDRVSLISDIRGSEKWPVRDLFQRDVDNKRIERSLLPYLETMDKIKFFNPLTLTVLPMGNDGHTVRAQMPEIVDCVVSEDNEKWCALERQGFYRVQWIEDNEQWARLKWNDTRSRLVAIDGQHRLSALKRFLVDHNAGEARDSFMSWRIPVIVVSFRAIGGQEPPSVLEVVRSIFIYINTQAHDVNKARAILLSDESVNSVCTQELIQYSHENDVKKPDGRDPNILPLLVYDWRGEESDKSRVAAPAAMKTVEEIKDWFEQYILGEDFDEGQKAALGIDPTHELHRIFTHQTMSYQESSLLRKHFRKELLPALSHVLQCFDPYRSYVKGLRKLEKSYMEGESREVASHAFTKLRFGTSHAPDQIRTDVDDMLEEIEREIEALKENCFDSLTKAEIGMRGIIFAFGYLANKFAFPDWMVYAKWFTAALNELCSKGWLTLGKRGKGGKFLHHVAVDHNDQIVNYRLDDAPKALGAYVALLVGTYGQPIADEWKVEWAPIKDVAIETISDTVNRGFKKEVRPLLKEAHPDGGTPLTNAVREEAQKRAGAQIRRFERELEKVERERQ